MKVLIVKASALGDVIHALPVLSWVARSGQAVEVDWLVEDSFAPILESHPEIRKVHVLRTRTWRREGGRVALREALKTIRSLRCEGYDVVIDLQGNSKSGLFTLFSGAPLRFGFDRHRVREWPNLIATNRKVSSPEGRHHIVDRYLTIAEAVFPMGAFDPAATTLSADPVALAAVDRTISRLGLGRDTLVVLHYGTTWKTKLWALERWCELARELASRDRMRMLLTWGNDEEYQAALTIKDAAGGRAVVWPKGGLLELAALLSRVELVIGGDTGPVHIAAALGTKTVSLFRVTDAERNGPRGNRHARLQVECACSPCLRKICEQDRECAQAIGHKAVLSAIDQLLEPSATRKIVPVSESKDGNRLDYAHALPHRSLTND